MRPHRLRVQAFGAFATTEQVSFDDLDGLFLLHGETGAGKTTLLDAIAFALYGRVPGERGTAKRLRSDHAAPGVTTEVELEATIGGRRLRITRKPEQDRPKKSGAGFTKEQAAVRLDEQVASGNWENKSTRVVEADQEIKDLMGMSAEQFFQVVLLPQGQFAQFLQAKAQEKEELLRKLFSTDRFRKVEDWLADRRRATADDVKKAAEAVDVLMARIAQASGTALPDEIPAPRAWVSDLTASAAVTRDAAAALVEARKSDMDTALAAKTEADQLASRQRRRRDALRRQADLAAAAPDIERDRAEADAAARAAEVAPVLDEADRAVAAAQAACRSEAAARAAIPAELAAPRPASPADPGDSTPQIPHTPQTDDQDVLRSANAHVLRAAAQAQQAQAGHFEALRAVDQLAAAEDAASADARSRAATLGDALVESRLAAAQRIEARPQATQARDAASQAATELPEAQAAAATARRMATDSAALVKERAKRDRLHEAHVTAREEAVESRSAALEVREQRIDGMRAELAATMTDDSPCPVCGSLDHPDPVEPTFEPVSREQEEKSNARAERAAADADKAGREVTAAETRIGEIAQRLAEGGFAALDGGDGDGDGTEVMASAGGALSAALQADAGTLAANARQVEADAKRLEAETARLKTQAAILANLQRRLDALDDAIGNDKAKIAELTEQRKAAVDEAEAAERRAAQHREELRAQLGGAVDLDAALTAAEQLAEAATAAAHAADEAARTEADLRDARQRAANAAIGAGFATVATGHMTGERDCAASGVAGGMAGETAGAAIEAARAAFREANWRREAVDQVKRHEADTEAVAALLADPDLDVALEPPAAVAETTVAADSAQQAHTVATGAHATANRTADELAKLKPLLDDKLTALAPLKDRADQARQLADLANGQGANQYKMTLSSFVLAARLEEVAAAASQRLRTMTGGRYSLAHSDARRGNSRAGLSLLACDSWTGIDRDTATLSGGETFLASLSLALGLADVVTAEAAGTPMEALFVDEGFGTLDEETLDEVMNVLDGLRAGGRIVGIVSHVTELRQRIPAQVHIAKGRHGSHVTVTAG